MTRIIGIVHRTKRTAEGEARPTMVAIQTDSKKAVIYKLEDETAELDFLQGRFPVSFRFAEEDEDLSQFPAHHIKMRKKKGEEEQSARVPETYDGLSKGDLLAMTLGGSGDRLAFAFSRRGEDVGAQLFRTPPYVLKNARGEGDKKDDHVLLTSLFSKQPEVFRAVTRRERDLIRLGEQYILRMDAQKARIACEQRLRQRHIGKIFLSEEGHYPEGVIEDSFDELKANNTALATLRAEEKAEERELRKVARELPVWNELFEPITGWGEVLFARFVSAVGDVRRFESAAKLKAFCGVHVMPDGGFVRRRRNQTCNWNPEARQALYLFGDQMVRRPDSHWGKVLNAYKVKFREKHPEPIVVDGKKKYTNGHIHKMAYWRTLTKFVEWLHREWTRLEANEDAGSDTETDAKQVA